MLVTKVSENTRVLLKDSPDRDEDYNRTYFREKQYLEQEKKLDTKRLGKFENDITKLSLYDF